MDEAIASQISKIDLQLLTIFRDGNTTFSNLLFKLGYVLQRIGCGNVAVIRTAPDITEYPTRSGFSMSPPTRIVEKIYPRSETSTGGLVVGSDIVPLVKSGAVMTRRVPILFLGSTLSMEFAISPWLIVVFPETSSQDVNDFPHHCERVKILMHHASMVAASLLRQTIDFEVANRIHRIITSVSFQKRTADHIFGYRLLSNISELSPKPESGSAFWRLSRTSGKIELAARRPVGVPRTESAHQASSPLACDVESFSESFLPSNRNRGQSSEPLKNQINCIVIAPNQSKDRAMVEMVGLTEKMVHCDEPSAPTEVTQSHVFNYRLASSNELIRGRIIHRSVSSQKQCDAIHRTVTSILHCQMGDPNDWVIIIPFGSKFPKSLKPDKEFDGESQSEASPSESLASREVGLIGAFVISLRRSGIDAVRMYLLVRLGYQVATSLDVFSIQRFRFRAFTNCIESITKAASTEELFLATEEIARRLLDCDGVACWSTEVGDHMPIYLSQQLKIPKRFLAEDPSQERIDPQQRFYNFPDLTDAPFWLQRVVEKHRGQPSLSDEVGGDKSNGVSGFIFRTSGSNERRLFYFVRLRSSRCTTQEVSFLTAFEQLISGALRRIVPKNTNESSIRLSDLESLMARPHQDQLLGDKVSLLDELIEEGAAAGYLWFTVDEDARLLLLDQARGHRSNRIRVGQGIPLESEALATICARACY